MATQPEDEASREQEYVRMLDEKTEIIRTLHEFIRELQEKIARLEADSSKRHEQERPG